MKFLGITVYAAAILTSIYAVPGGHGHGNKNQWRHEHDYTYHKISPAKTITIAEATTTEIKTMVVTEEEIPLEEIDYPGIIPLDDALPPLLEGSNAECPLSPNSLFGEELLHFTGIFYRHFRTGGTGQDILGPLAVGGNFHAPNYIVNANHQVNCNADEKTSFDSVGLVIGGDSTTHNTHLRGDDLIAGDGNAEQFDQQLAGCRVITDEGTGHFDFPRSASDALTLSEVLAGLSTNRVLHTNGVVSAVPNSNDDDAFKVFHFDTCRAASCHGSDASRRDEIFFAMGNWNGPNGDVPSNDDTVVFNVPVTSGETITLRTNAPTHGFNSCKTIYNFYPVDDQGNFDPDGEITIHRETGSQLEGLVIAPRAHIRDGNTGNFAGTVVGLDYGWLDHSAGVEIHDWRAAGCPNYAGCIPRVGGSSGGGGTTTTTTSTSSSTVPVNPITRPITTPEPTLAGNTDTPTTEAPPPTEITTSESTTSVTETPDTSMEPRESSVSSETSVPDVPTVDTTTETSDTTVTSDENGSVTSVTEQASGTTQTIYVVGEEEKWKHGYHGDYKKKNKEKKHKKGGNGYNKKGKSW